MAELRIIQSYFWLMHSEEDSRVPRVSLFVEPDGTAIGRIAFLTLDDEVRTVPFGRRPNRNAVRFERSL
jgi:hypothetical protein